jgi:acetate CoA/acetoacetate CoA-transferase alpha subunit
MAGFTMSPDPVAAAPSKSAPRTTLRADAAAAMIPDGASVMFGGFMGVGSPERIFDALVARNARGLTIIGNDTARPGVGVGKLIDAGCVARAIVSHIGTNPVTQRKMIAGEIAVELVPQGTLAERIRAGGAGLGGFLTPTGIGTVVAEGKRTIEIDGRSFLLELPLRAQFALVHAFEADYYRNLTYRLTAANFNPVIAMAADCVIAQADEIVPVGVIPPDAVRTPGILVHHLVERAR